MERSVKGSNHYVNLFEALERREHCLQRLDIPDLYEDPKVEP
jgi:hypothetical protein